MVEGVRTVSEFRKSISIRNNIRDLVIIGLSAADKIAVGSNSVPDINISQNPGPNNVPPSKVDWGNVKGGTHVWGCNAAHTPLNTSIAKKIANASQRPVEAYSNYVTLGPNGPVTTGVRETLNGIARGFDFGGRVDVAPDRISGIDRW